jgi:Methyltransferase FkbM domain
MGVLCTMVAIREYSIVTFDLSHWSEEEPESEENTRDLEAVPKSSYTPIEDVVAPTSSPVDRREKYQYHAPEERTLDEIESKAAEFCGSMEDDFASYWALDLKERTRLDEDKRIYHLFFRHLDRKETQDFHYVELGAFDGIQESNTRFFDVCLGWDGLLIEANPKVYPRLVTNRPNSHRMSYAASCSTEEEAANKTVRFWASIFTNAAEDVSPNREAYAKSNLATDVLCGSLSPVLLDLFPSKRVHFFSLDTEGVEYSVLSNIDFDEIFIDVLISENWNNFCQQKCEGRDKVRAFMKSKGFLLYPNTIQYSDLYVNPRSEFAKLVPTDEVQEA